MPCARITCALKMFDEPLQEIFSRKACPEPCRRDAKHAKLEKQGKYFLCALCALAARNFSRKELERVWRETCPHSYSISTEPWLIVSTSTCWRGAKLWKKLES